ncbi:MAG: hypothetical protein WAO28_04645 [Candidatus Microsaccharimonas sp.]
MPKPLVIAGAVIGAVVVVGGGILIATNLNKGAPAQSNDTTNSTQSSNTKLVDPDGVYDYFSDPSVTKFPAKGATFGNGQTLTFEYDGSKTNNDTYATLSYQLYYIQSDGKVQPMTGGNLEGKGSGTFTVSDLVFNSNAKDASGFFELIGTYDTGTDDSGKITGKNVTLGMYPIKFEISE